MTATLETLPSVPTAARTTAAPQPLHLRTDDLDDLDEVRVWTTSDSGRHSRVVHQRGPLGFELTASGGDIVRVAWGRLALEQTLRGSTRKLCLHVPRAGASRYTFGRERHEVGPGQAIVLPRDWEHTRRSEPLAMAALAIDSDAWQRELRARHPDLGPDDPLHPRVLDLGAPAQAPLGRAIDELLAVAANPADPATTAAQRALAEAAFVDTLADALRRATAWVHVPTIAACTRPGANRRAPTAAAASRTSRSAAASRTAAASRSSTARPSANRRRRPWRAAADDLGGPCLVARRGAGGHPRRRSRCRFDPWALPPVRAGQAGGGWPQNQARRPRRCT